MARDPRSPVDDLLSQIRSCLDAATGRPGLVKASVYQSEGYLRGLQGLPWELPATPLPGSEDAAASFLHDVRAGAVALRGRLKKYSDECLNRFEMGFHESFPEAKEKPFAGAVSRLWVRWLGNLVVVPGDDAGRFSFETGRGAGALLKAEYEEGISGHLAGFLLDKRLHLGRVADFLRMRGWLLGTVEHLRRSADAAERERAEILNANFSSIVLRALHNAGPGYAAQAAAKLESMTRDLDAAIANLKNIEPEASNYLRNNRSTIIAKALHSGDLDYGDEVSSSLPAALKKFESRIESLSESSPETADELRSKKRTLVYRALTNGRLNSFLK